MFIKFIDELATFLAANPMLVGLILAVVEYAKRAIIGFGWVWFKPAYFTVLGFLLGFLLVIPATGFAGIVWFDFIAHGLGLGLVATGLYKVGSTIAKTASG